MLVGTVPRGIEFFLCFRMFFYPSGQLNSHPAIGKQLNIVCRSGENFFLSEKLYVRRSKNSRPVESGDVSSK